MSKIKLLEHFPLSARSGTEQIDKLSGFGTPGETVALSFALASSEEISEIELSAADLIGEQKTIPAERMELYIVNVWDVSGVGCTKAERRPRAELLLKDDRELLEDGYLEHPLKGAGSCNPLWLYSPPKVRLAGNANTSLTEGEHKQIWLSIKLPEDMPPGIYKSKLTICTDRQDSFHLHVELEVLPFSLMRPAQDLMIWYRGSMDKRNAQFYVSPDIFRLQLQDIYDHGFRSISICEQDRQTAQLAIDIAEQVGFDRHIVLREVPINAEALTFRKLTPVFYLSDELDSHLQIPDGLTESHINKHRGHGAYCELLNWTSMMSIVCRQFAERLQDDNDIGYKPDIFSLSLPDNKDLFAGDEVTRVSELQRPYYYWQSHMEKPNLHRVLAGSYLWKTGAAGITPYCYQHAPIFPFSPFDDFDVWEKGYQSSFFRDRMTTYPAQSGVIPTLQWEGLREGITDLQYLTTLDHYVSLAESCCSQEAKELAAAAKSRRDTFLERIDIHEINIESCDQTEPYPHISPIEYQNFRKQLAVDISRLIAHLKELTPQAFSTVASSP